MKTFLSKEEIKERIDAVARAFKPPFTQEDMRKLMADISIAFNNTKQSVSRPRDKHQ